MRRFARSSRAMITVIALLLPSTAMMSVPTFTGGATTRQEIGMPADSSSVIAVPSRGADLTTTTRQRHPAPDVDVRKLDAEIARTTRPSVGIAVPHARSHAVRLRRISSDDPDPH